MKLKYKLLFSKSKKNGPTEEELGVPLVTVYLVIVVFNLTNTQFLYRLFVSLSDSYKFLGELRTW